MEYDKIYGKVHIDNRLNVLAITESQQTHFAENIQPILESRCVVCHG